MYRKRNRKARMARRHKKGYNYHHLTPASRNGGNVRQNLLFIKVDRHDLWHRLWGNRTLEEVIALLQRVARMKGRTKHYRLAA